MSDSPSNAQFIDPSSAPTKKLRYDRGDVLRLVDEGVGARNVDLHINTIRRGSAPGPYHLHHEVENVYYVLEGQIEIRTESGVRRVGPGQVVFFPPGVAHSATNIGDSDARLMEIYAPAGPDFVELEPSDND